MAISDLLFLVSLPVLAALIMRLVWLMIRGRWAGVRSAARNLTIFVGVYGLLLVGFALATPRRELGAGERKCFDDWCVAAGALEREPTAELCPGSASVWVASLEVVSVARRVRQRAADASVELEDAEGRRYSPCTVAAAEKIRDYLGPGDSLSISLPFGLPAGARPAGLVVHHGAFPGLIIIGDDQSWLHLPTLLRLKE